MKPRRKNIEFLNVNHVVSVVACLLWRSKHDCRGSPYWNSRLVNKVGCYKVSAAGKGGVHSFLFKTGTTFRKLDLLPHSAEKGRYTSTYYGQVMRSRQGWTGEAKYALCYSAFRKHQPTYLYYTGIKSHINNICETGTAFSNSVLRMCTVTLPFHLHKQSWLARNISEHWTQENIISSSY